MKIKTIILILGAAALASCTKDTLPRTAEGSFDLELDLVMPEAVPQGAQTRAAVGPVKPDVAINAFNLCVIPDEADKVEWYHDYLGYDNLKGAAAWTYSTSSGIYSLNSYSYTPRGATTTMPRLGLFPTKGNVTVYGIYPQVPDFEKYIPDLDHIAYTVGTTNATNYDYMYVDPVYVDMTGVKPGDTQNRTLAFKHVMTAIELRLTTTHVGTVEVDSVALHAYDGSERAEVFSMKGTYSAKNGAVEPAAGSYVDSLNITHNSAVNYKFNAYVWNRYTPYAFIFPSVEHKAGRWMRATIYFKHFNNDDSDLVGQTAVMDFKFDNIETGGLKQGLVTGYRYVYTAEIDNFIKYSGYPEIEEWVVPTDDPDDDQVKDIII